MIGKIQNFRSNSVIKRLQPDGVIIRGVVESIELLEFTHTGDLWPDSLTAARDKKETKYETLQREIQLLYPEAEVSVIPFVVGARSYLDEAHWGQSWTRLQLPPAQLDKLLPQVQAWNIEGAREMLRVRSTIRKGVG